MNQDLKFDSIEDISVGGSYTLGADGKLVRQTGASTSLESIANGAPGPVAESHGAAADGVAPAQPAAAAASGATTTTATKGTGKAAA